MTGSTPTTKAPPAATANGSGTLENIKPSDLKDSPINHRKSYPQESIDAIASTAREVGILETLLARPVGKGGKGRELVFGHRRKRAAIAVELPTVPVLVRAMTDKQVRIAQLIENGQREDAPPLEEADGYQALIQKDGMTVADVCAAVGKEPSYVYRRLSLTSLTAKGRKALEAGELRIGVAELIARLADPKAQAEAVKDLTGTDHHGALVTIAAARASIERDYLRDLKGAPFNPKDAELIPVAGACTGCPKRTGANPDLFGDLTGTNTCTDGVCFEEKARASWKATAKKHKAAGGRVLTKAETATAFPYKHSAAMAFDGEWQELTKEKRKELKAAGVELPPTAIARDPDGRARTLVAKADMAKTNKAARKNGAPASSSSSSAPSAAEKKRTDAAKKKAEVERLAGRLGAKAIACAIKPEHTSDVGFWLTLARVVIIGAWHDTNAAACKRRGVTVPKGGAPDEELMAHAKAIASGEANPDNLKATTCELLAGLVVEVASKAGSSPSGMGAEEAMRYLGIERKTLKAEAAAELKAEAKAKRDAATAKKKAATAKKKATAAKKKATASKKKAKGKA